MLAATAVSVQSQTVSAFISFVTAGFLKKALILA